MRGLQGDRTQVYNGPEAGWRPPNHFLSSLVRAGPSLRPPLGVRSSEYPGPFLDVQLRSPLRLRCGVYEAERARSTS